MVINVKVDDVKGKEVIDEKGNIVGEVEDIDLDFRNRRIEGLVLRESGLTGKIGRGETKVVPCNMIDAIGEKVLLKGKPLTQEDLDIITGGE